MSKPIKTSKFLANSPLYRSPEQKGDDARKYALEVEKDLDKLYELFKTHIEVNSVDVGSKNNHTQIKSDGEIALHGTARVVKSAWLSAGAVRAVGAAPGTVALNDDGFIVIEFADAADDYAQSNIKIPEDMDMSVDSQICLGWSVPNTTQAMDWGYGYVATGINDDTQSGSITTGTETVTSSNIADGMVVTPIATIAGGTIAATDVCLHLYIYRDVSADTYGADVDLHGMAFKYTSNKLGKAP